MLLLSGLVHHVLTVSTTRATIVICGIWFCWLLEIEKRVRKTRKRVKIYLPFFWGDIYNRDALSCVVLVVALPETNMFKKSYKKTGSNELT